MIDFSAIDSSLLQRAHELLPAWLPGGKFRGQEYFCSGLAGGAGDSMHVTVKSDSVEYFDFADPNCSGVGMVSLYGRIHGLRNGEAAKQLADSYGLNGVVARRPRTNGNHGAPQLPAPEPAAATPAPTTAPDPPEPPAAGHTALYRYSATWFIARHDKADGSKTFRPWRWTGSAWEPKAPARPRPLYRMADAPPDTPLLIVEGEKACHAAAGALQSHYVITWAGGAAAVGTSDWSPIRGRAVVIWPDADEPGRAAAAKIAALLLKQSCAVRLMDPPDDWDAGYDAADAVADGLDLAALVAGAKPLKEKTSAAKQEDAERPAYLEHQDLGLAGNERGPYPTEANAVIILKSHPEFAGRIWLNTFAGRIMIDERPFDMDLDAVRCQVWMQQSLKLPKMPFSAVQRAVLLLASANQRNPLKNFLDSLTWDGTDRLTTFLEDSFGADTEGQLEYIRAIGKNWMVAAVARIYSPGCQFKNCLIAEGPQDAGKSSAVRILGGEYFLENIYNPTRQRIDFLQTLQGKWIVEIPEFDRAGDVTAILSLQTDSYRGSYGRTPMDHPRQCVFFGTTNYGQYHSDVTGAVRLWSFRSREVNLEYLRQQREQLWAEAVARYKRGETWHVVPLDQAREQQEARRDGDPWQSIVARWIQERPYRDPTGEIVWCTRAVPVEKIFVTDILLEAVQRPAGQWSNADERRIAGILRALGWERRKIRHEGRPQWGFVPRDTGNLQETMRTTSRVAPPAGEDSDIPY